MDLYKKIEDIYRKIAKEAIKLEKNYGEIKEKRFVNWKHEKSGGGERLVLKGKLFEKAGINFSIIENGVLDKKIIEKIPKKPNDDFSFSSCGISIVMHPSSAHVPAIHMNIRHIKMQEEWVAGCIDLNPAIVYEEDKDEFHEKLEKICNRVDSQYYKSFKKNCDKYFQLPHRKKARGIGGIFFDYLERNEKNEKLIFSVAQNFINIYSSFIKKRYQQPCLLTDYEKLLEYRGLYAEFNLLYDRGTAFGLNSGGNVDAILMSLPPLASWK